MDVEDLRGATAVVGGGGKTSLIWYLASRLSPGVRVMITTSTHILRPPCEILHSPTPEALSRALDKGAPVCACSVEPDGKLAPPDNLDALVAACDVALIEADGSRGLPLKAPAAHEPAIPPCARRVIVVAGMDGVGQPIARVCHRSPLFARLCGKEETGAVTPEDVALVLLSPQGGLKNAYVPVTYLLNKADNPARLAAARQVARRLPGAIIASIQNGYFETWQDGRPK